MHAASITTDAEGSNRRLSGDGGGTAWTQPGFMFGEGFQATPITALRDGAFPPDDRKMTNNRNSRLSVWR